VLDPTGLQNNGGPTQTIALQAGSPAINAGDEAICATGPVWNLDQRGYVRPGTGSSNCSIGAYEFDSPGFGPPTPTSSVTMTPTQTPTPTPTPTSGCVEPFPPNSCLGILDGGGGSRCLIVTAPDNCCWTATVQDWCSHAWITQGSAGCGNGVVCFEASVSECYEHLANIHLTVGDKSCDFTQLESPTPPPATWTPSPTLTPSATPAPLCVGDCNNDGHVTVDDILTMVNIALGNLPVTDCLPGDVNSDGQITEEEILAAVNNAFNGCPGLCGGAVCALGEYCCNALLSICAPFGYGCVQ
jgi:hypothetical protein